MSRTSAGEALAGGSRPLTRLCPSPRSGGPVLIKNPHLDSMEEDILYHLDLGTRTHNLPAMFGDIKVSGRGRSEAAAPRPASSPSPCPTALPSRAGAPLLWALPLEQDLASCKGSRWLVLDRRSNRKLSFKIPAGRYNLRLFWPPCQRPGRKHLSKASELGFMCWRWERGCPIFS